MAFPFYGKNGPMILWVMWIETIIASLILCARMYTRTMIVHGMGWDDHLIVVTQFLFIAYTLTCTVAALNGMGSHAADLGHVQTVIAVKWEIAAQSFNILAIGTSKNSVAVFLLRIVVKRIHKFFLWFCIASTTFTCISCIVFMFTQCTPLESIFDPTLPRTCYLNFTSNAIFSGSYTAIIDFALAIFPWFILWQLNMKRKERIVVVFGLSLGVFAGICGVIRAIELQAIRNSSDYTYVTLPLILWGSTELLVCILCASIPTLRPLYKTIRGTSSSHDIYELGNTPSRALENGSTIQGKSAYLSRSASRPFGGTSATGMSTMVSMGQQHENSSDEEILRDIKGRMDTTNSGKEEQIYRTTQVDITYSTGI